ncbi:Uu.00g141020.m01.CDS01 [Anthostomella pinea]|uniref:Uu.00g141020.m01.CDS01 n=1 Tax=Anthostomella pinea TaxID=933095 RepID=A0AAI8YJ14_9PEZI|nr:Uu.00g141020.m01.CDS01 [Anthostomella pinea]
MGVTRISLIAVAGPEKQEEAVKVLANFVNDCKKPDGKTYIISSKAAKCAVMTDHPGSQPGTIAVEVVFTNEEDAEYYQNEDPAFRGLLGRVVESSGWIVVKADF